ncbi:MAG: hypothetical protein NC406_09105 [Bacteroides sp.]|nr:hypothetical protein [Bacteroides sp.]MCM1096216.1 hypothetical protein [Terasakiella sp.]
MARDFNTQLQSLSAKMTVVAERYAALEQKYRDAREDIIRLRAEVLARDRELEKLRTEAEYLRVASTLGSDRASVEATREMLADLVRDIDRCIADLIE